MHADNSAHLALWRAEQEQARRERVEALLAVADAGKASWRSVAEFLDLAQVKRTWLYDSKYAERVLEIRDATRLTGKPTAVPRVQRASDDSLRERLATALAENQRLRSENSLLAEQLAQALGLLRAARTAGSRD